MAWHDITIPSHIHNHSNDYVAYRVEGESADRTNMPCYMSHMNSLSNYSFRCFPNSKSSILPYDLFAKWINLCKEHGLIPHEVEINEDGHRNIMTIPKNSYDKHLIYAALCCYRWSENQALIPFTIIKLLEANPNINFFQTFHYALVKYVTNTNHSFCSLYNPRSYMSYYGSNGRSGQYFLPWNLAICIFFAKDYLRKSLDATHTSIAKVITSLGMEEPIRPPKGQIAELCVNQPEHLLWNEWADLYKMGKYTKEKIVAYYNKVMATKKIS